MDLWDENSLLRDVGVKLEDVPDGAVFKGYETCVFREATFQALKSKLGLRPYWRLKDDRIGAHLFPTVLAYRAVHLIRARMKSDGLCRTW